MKYLTIVWEWMKDNSVGIIVGGLVLIYMIVSSAILQTETEKENEIFKCKSTCFPKQSELIANGDEESCWCYIDQNTLGRTK
tara:strand:+ start:220 stop:465 length:246 start_codon:yes stop_codon:yes gene_type:complete